MTSEQRAAVRVGRDQAVRARVAVVNESDGAPDCAYCGADIAEPSPRKRFCTETCRRRFWDYHTPQGKRQRVAAKRVWREQRRTAA